MSKREKRPQPIVQDGTEKLSLDDGRVLTLPPCNYTPGWQTFLMDHIDAVQWPGKKTPGHLAGACWGRIYDALDSGEVEDTALAKKIHGEVNEAMADADHEWLADFASGLKSIREMPETSKQAAERYRWMVKNAAKVEACTSMERVADLLSDRFPDHLIDCTALARVARQVGLTLRRK